MKRSKEKEQYVKCSATLRAVSGTRAIADQIWMLYSRSGLIAALASYPLI